MAERPTGREATPGGQAVEEEPDGDQSAATILWERVGRWMPGRYAGSLR